MPGGRIIHLWWNQSNWLENWAITSKDGRGAGKRVFLSGSFSYRRKEPSTRLLYANQTALHRPPPLHLAFFFPLRSHLISLPFKKERKKILYISYIYTYIYTYIYIHIYIYISIYIYIYNFRFPRCDIYSTWRDTAENSWISRSPESSNPLLICPSSRRPLLPYRSGRWILLLPPWSFYPAEQVTIDR